MKKYKSPIGWMGGKSRMVNTLLPLLPEHRGYIEAFGGAGHLLFGKEPSNWEVLNDYDGNLMNFWAVVKNAPEQLIESFNYTLVSRRTFDEYKAVYKKGEYDDCIQRAHIFYYMVRATFGASMRTPSFGTKRDRSNLKIENIERDIMQAYERLKTVVIENVSFERILKTYDGKDSLFFLDPPYRNTAKYSSGGFEDDQYKLLAELCTALEGRFILTINDDPLIRELFAGFDVTKHNVRYSISRDQRGRRRYGEMIVRNY